MYQAKDAGDTLCVYTPARDPADLAGITLAGQLPDALAADQISLTYLPIVDLSTGQAYAAEALPRWRHPDRGVLSPAAFLAAVDRAGLLAEFTTAVLDQAFADAVVWEEAGVDLGLAVNISPRSLLDPGFPDHLLALIERHQLPARRCTLELTDWIPAGDTSLVADALERFADAEVAIALDDFGSGSSSFRLLHWLPVRPDALKIGRADVGRLHTPTGDAVIHAITDLGRRLQVPVIAVGVETAEDRHTLWQAGCTGGQGAALGGLVPSEQLVQAVQRGALAEVLHAGADVVPLRSIAPGS